jgi:transcriptional regulator with XRE-family HTH domain
MPPGAHEEGLRVARVLLKWIKERGMSTREVEARVGWGQKTLYEVLTGNQPLKISHIAAVAEAAGFSLEAFYRALAADGADGNAASSETIPEGREIVPGVEDADLLKALREFLARYPTTTEPKE